MCFSWDASISKIVVGDIRRIVTEVFGFPMDKTAYLIFSVEPSAAQTRLELAVVAFIRYSKW